MPKIVLTDSGFWIGLFNITDTYHQKSTEINDLIKEHQVILPWPCLYEIVSTRLAKHMKWRRDSTALIEDFLRHPNLIRLDDTEYKEKALLNVFEQNRYGQTHSLVDSVLREILKDDSLRLNFFVTYNEKDFDDVCQLRQIEMITQNNI